MIETTCSVDGCARRDIVGRGMCNMHYQRWRKHEGKEIIANKPLRVMPKCQVDDCDRLADARGWCNRHYENWRKYGDPIPWSEQPIEHRLLDVGWTVTERGCWEWNGKRNDNGYGLITSKKYGLDGARVHRVIYELRVGEIPQGAMIRHSCDNPPCMNPAHLQTGSRQDNIDDMMRRGRHWAQTREVCRNGHDLTLPGAVKQTSRERLCVICGRARSNRWIAKQRAMRLAAS